MDEIAATREHFGAQGPWADLALHSIGWKAFQDLCSQVCEEILHRLVQIYREAQDGGQDAVFLASTKEGVADATIQCKHSSDPRKRLKPGDITPELAKVDELVATSQADTYILITSMSVDAPVARQIRNTLRDHGVRKPHVLGREWLTRAIRSSARLRALVPQVYGLGDLTTILDERLVQRTRALLEQWIPKLRLYVTTEAHRKAVHALNEHGAVLLLGNPSAGKSTIGAILSTIAVEDADHTVLHLTSPRDFEEGWNPHDRKRFFWIDEAFGSNVTRDEYVQDWTSAFRKVQAAIAHGNRFLLTSRRHIYEGAKPRLGQRNLPVFIDGRAVVDVGALSAAEKAQILYNHIAFGNQTKSWKRSVKPYLDAVANVDEFLPGVAERLGDPAFTKGLKPSPVELIRFMKEPREYLIDTISALDDPLRAALMLIYVHQGRLLHDQWDDEASYAVADLLSVQLGQVRGRMAELKGSFVNAARVEGAEVWSFAHPTIADALTETLRGQSHMAAALLRGIRPENILSGFVSEGVPSVRDASIIPASMNDVVARRIAAVEDSRSVNANLFWFLAYRTSDDLLARVLRLDSTMLRRKAWSFHRAGDDPRMKLFARAYSFGLLPRDLRDDGADYLEGSVLEEFDLSALDEGDLLALLPPERLVALGLRLRMRALPDAPAKIDEIANDADLDEDPESHFDRFNEGFETLSGLAQLDDDTETLLDEARQAVAAAVGKLEKRKKAKEAEKEDDPNEWHYMSTTSTAVTPISAPDFDRPTRSIFTDVDA